AGEPHLVIALLHDRPENGAVLHFGQHVVVAVHGHDLDLTFLAGFDYRPGRAQAAVAITTRDRDEVWVRRHGRGIPRRRLRGVRLIVHLGDDLHAVLGEVVLVSPGPVQHVWCRERSDG